MKNFKKLMCVVATILIFSIVITPPQVYAGNSLSSITNDSIKEKQDQIKQSEQLKKDLQNNLTNAKAVKKELETLKSNVSAYITKLDAEIADVQENIEYYKGLIIDKETEIAEITVELEEAIEVETAQYEAMKKRIKMMYERGDSFYLEIMLSSNSFGDFLTKADYIEKLSAYDRKKLNEFTEIRQWTELVKVTLEAEKQALDQVKESLEAEEAALNELLSEKQDELAKYKQQIKDKEQQIMDFEADIVEQTTVIAQLEAAVLEEQKAIAAANGMVFVYDGGRFTWPAPAYVAITDNFGYRTDPINGSTSYHSGIDMAAPAGSAILAAYDGVVVAADYNWSMGNYVMISHGGGLYTVYMHSSKLLCKKDDMVLRGEKIALVGTTGRSTGNHLHFSVRLNGQYVDPMPYLKK